jgi:hypothetical protein
MRGLLAADGEGYEQGEDRLPVGQRDVARFPAVAAVPAEGGERDALVFRAGMFPSGLDAAA